MNKIELTNAEALNIIAFYNKLNEENESLFDGMSNTAIWRLMKNIDTLKKEVKFFEDYRNDLVKKLQEEWFTEEKTVEIQAPKLDEDGKEMLDETGSVITESARQLKEEYQQPYMDAVKEADEKLAEILKEKNEYSIKTIDLDEEIEKIGEKLTRNQIGEIATMFDWMAKEGE